MTGFRASSIPELQDAELAQPYPTSFTVAAPEADLCGAAARHLHFGNGLPLFGARRSIPSLSLRLGDNHSQVDAWVLVDHRLGPFALAFLQSHQVRVPIANILGLIDLFEFDTPSDPINGVILNKLKTVAESLDIIIQEIVQNTSRLKA